MTDPTRPQPTAESTSGPLTADLPAGVADWMVTQRWYAGKGGTPALSVLGGFPLGAAESLLVTDRSPIAPALYQVPLAPCAADPGIPGSDGLADGPRTASYAEALLALAVGGGVADGGAVTATGVPLGWPGAVPTVRSARVLSGEQSNTSVIVETAQDDAPSPTVMLKVFRTLHHGENPDVVLQAAIAAAGSRRVPRTYGAVLGEWPDPGEPSGRASGHLAVAQEFLADTQDAWRVALGAARAGEDFTTPARDLGAATAEVHGILADTFATVAPDAAARAAVLASMRGRAARAAALVPQVAAESAAIGAVLAAAEDAEWPDLQRVHGDFHLGQVLLVPGRGWVLLDFEGEPLRPMTERTLPDVPLRDVAGMLRSFDYVAGTVAHEGGDAGNWAADVRAAFLDGYVRQSGRPLAPFAPLLSALELDKALYECEYEARNRPDWLPIPATAVRRLAGAAA